MKFFALICFLTIFLAGCAADFSRFYDPWYETGDLPASAFLKEGENPTVISTPDLKTKFREVASHWYWCIGYSGFNSADKDDYFVHQELIDLCKEKKAKIAIWGKQYTNTRSGTYFIPHTNYYSYTDYNGYPHSYTTTTYSTYPYAIDRYNYSAYLFVPIPKEYRMQYAPGFAVSDLNQSDREIYRQNTGCLIDIVYKNTEAYFANILYGDIITQINNRRIYTKKDFHDVRRLSKVGDTWNMTIVRNGQTQNVTLKYKL